MKITSPCTEAFSKMPKAGPGRHCSLCSKTVIDFTAMSQAEIVAYFKTAPSGEVCGRFKSLQLEQRTGFEKLVFSTREYILNRVQALPLRLPLLAALSGLMAFMSSCMGAVARPADDEAEQNSQVAQDTIKTVEQKKVGPN